MPPAGQIGLSSAVNLAVAADLLHKTGARPRHANDKDRGLVDDPCTAKSAMASRMKLRRWPIHRALALPVNRSNNGDDWTVHKPGSIVVPLKLIVGPSSSVEQRRLLGLRSWVLGGDSHQKGILRMAKLQRAGCIAHRHIDWRRMLGHKETRMA